MLPGYSEFLCFFCCAFPSDNVLNVFPFFISTSLWFPIMCFSGTLFWHLGSNSRGKMSSMSSSMGQESCPCPFLAGLVETKNLISVRGYWRTCWDANCLGMLLCFLLAFYLQAYGVLAGTCISQSLWEAGACSAFTYGFCEVFQCRFHFVSGGRCWSFKPCDIPFPLFLHF